VNSASPISEEAFQELRTFLTADSSDLRDSMVQHVGVGEIKAAPCGTSFRVMRAEDEHAESAVDHRASAHHTRLKGDDQQALLEVPVANNDRGVT